MEGKMKKNKKKHNKEKSFSMPVISLEKMEEREYDALIIGTGAGGGAAIWRLCKQWENNGKRIGVIEAGDMLLSKHANESRLRNTLNFYQQVSTPIGKNLPKFSGAKQLFALGGRTLFWGAVSPQFPISEMIDWPVSIKEISNYYNIAENIMNVTNTRPKNSINIIPLLQQLHKNGFPQAEALPAAVNYLRSKQKTASSPQFFTSLSFLQKALKHRSFDLAINARAIQVLTNKNKVVSVEVVSAEKKTFLIKSKKIILATGALETPRILLHSGITGKAVGHYLTNHSFVLAHGKWDREFAKKKAEILIPQTQERPYQIQIHIVNRDVYIAGFGRVESRLQNKVFLDNQNKDERGVPTIQVNFSYSNKDQVIIEQLVTAIKKIATALGVSLLTQKGQPFIQRKRPGEDYHESGTCRMGADPSKSVTNSYGEVHGINGLYVADCSVLPSIGAVNPVLTTVALVIRTVDHMVENYSRGI